MEKLTISQWYKRTREALSRVPVDSPGAEALMLCEEAFSLSGRIDLVRRGDEYPDPARAAWLGEAVSQRGDRPLQYILGHWEFCGLDLAVGEGVLVPREDTAALVDTVCRAVEGIAHPRILDLCAGSGAVALAVADRTPGSICTCVELSDGAIPYLRRNVERYGGGRVDIIKADVLSPPGDIFARGSFDAVCANPPYIPSGDISSLMREVRQEPRLALDGGGDGLDFYRAISRLWTPLLRCGGILAVEIGAGQESDVSRIFVRGNLTDIGYEKDLNGKIRVIYGTHTEKI